MKKIYLILLALLPLSIFAQTPPPQPVITASGVTSCMGGDTLRVSSVGAGSHYFWYFNDQPIQLSMGVYYTTDTFYVARYSGTYTVFDSTASLPYSDSTTYSPTSMPYVVTGLPLQSITIYDGIPSIRCSGGTADLSVSSFSNVTYQWYKDGVSISGATDTLYSGVASSGNYSVQISFTNGCIQTIDTIITQSTAIIDSIYRNPIGDSIVAFASGGLSPYRFTPLWTNYNSFENDRISIDSAGSYTATTTDAYGCTSTTNTLVVTADTISGIVINSSNAVVPNTTVYLFVANANNNIITTGSYAQTNSSGYYSMITISPKGYLVADLGLSDSIGYLTTYYPSTPVIQNSTLINFNANTFTANFILIDAAQSSGSGQISGVIDSSALGNARQGLVFRTASTGSAPIAGLKIILLNANNQPVAATTTAANGFFQFTNLATGNYKLWVDGYGIDNTTAPVVTVSSGTSSSSTNLQLALSGTSLRVTSVTGITSATTNNGISVYPNPTSSSLNVSVSGFQSNAFSYVLSDSQGNQLTKGQGTSTIDVSGMEPGLYILSIQTAQTVTNQKIIIER